MLQLTRVSGRRMMAALSLCCGIAVALIAGAGGLMSLANWEVGIGSRFEFAAATIAILWLVSLGVVIAMPNLPLLAWRPGMAAFRRRGPAAPSASSQSASDATASRPQTDAGGLAAQQ